MTWNGQILAGGPKSDDTQIARVLQILLHYRNEGVRRKDLMRILDEDSSADDVHHLLRTVIYNVRRKLKEVGLPGPQYIEFRGGKYYWASDVQVWEDAGAFEDLYARAEAEDDPEIKEELYREACYMYNGEFLPNQMRLVWVSDEDRRYTNIFSLCVEVTAEFLRRRRDFAALEELGRHASRVSPFNEWEALIMEALTSLGQYKQAQELYEKTVEMYQREMGIKPSISMINKLDAHASRLEYRSASPDEIYEQLQEDLSGKGGQFCSYPVFKGIYKMIRRANNYISEGTFLMICTLTGAGEMKNKQKSRLGSEKMPGLSDMIIAGICDSLKDDDLVCRFTRDQFLVLLMDRTVETCGTVRDSIDANCRKRGLDISLEYDIRPVVE